MVALDLAGSLRHGLVADAAGTDHKIRDLQSFTLKRDAPRVALVAVGMSREETSGIRPPFVQASSMSASIS